MDLERDQRLGMALVFIMFCIWIWSNLGHASKVDTATYVVCRTVFLKERAGTTAIKLNTLTNIHTFVLDGIYEAREPWCLYSIKNGIAREVDND